MSKEKLVFSAFGLMIFLIGIGVTYHGFDAVRVAMASSSWPRAEGKMLMSRVGRSGTTARTSDEGVATRKAVYKLSVLYEYTVNGKLYKSNRISDFDVEDTCKSCLKTIQSRYRENTPVKVYYDPAKPQEALLEPGLTWKSLRAVGAGIVGALVGGLILVVGLFGKVKKIEEGDEE